MLTRQERSDIRKCIAKAERYGKGCVQSRNALGTLDEIALVDTPHLLDALDNAEAEIRQLRDLLGKLYKIVNMASHTNCDHRCFTRETRAHLFATLAAARLVTAQTKVRLA